MKALQDPHSLLTLTLIIFFIFILLVVSFFLISYSSFKRILAAKKRESEMIIANKNKLMQSNLEVQEKERIRIASELHDGIIGKIAAIRLQVALEQPAAVLDTQIGEAIDELRKISHDLYPPMYEVQTLDIIVANVLQHYHTKYNISTNYNIDPNATLPLREKIQTLRIVQELLHNIEKHANATTIDFQLRITQQTISFLLSDNGVGMDISNKKDGQGLQNIELRCMSIGATYKYKWNKNGGTKFIFIAPLRKED